MAHLAEQAVDAAARKQHDQQQQRPEDDLPIFGNAGQHLLQQQQSTAPNTGPKAEPMPPSTTMMMRSPERVQYIIAGLTKSV